MLPTDSGFQCDIRRDLLRGAFHKTYPGDATEAGVQVMAVAVEGRHGELDAVNRQGPCKRSTLLLRISSIRNMDRHAGSKIWLQEPAISSYFIPEEEHGQW